ncbi:nucleotidyltransferase family protein [Mucilaginibacter lacusdianchii]|uniref:nucleotidyltransferase family protein n=1 Tax=Mucilaginibacter lacusdianchii TaxID=2684211 RepID=UPI00131E5FE0|nr:nucleotidyltransferase family protein [Mucilaginibacter sp. JXJ CY 39]
MKLSTVILAAGPSRRLGQPKQNLRFKEKTLLQHAIFAAGGVSDHVLVVLGASRERIEDTIQDLPVEILFNARWSEGMAYSIRTAVSHLVVHYPVVTHILFMVCDQPLIAPSFLEQLIQTAGTSGRGIVATGYNGIAGVPAVFSVKYYPELIALVGDEGARQLMRTHPDDMRVVPYLDAELDIDTDDDYQWLLNNK